jgi:ribosomal protein S18 acetylase RimI-like enzyme
MLMQRIHEWAIAKGANAIELNVHAFNTGAISLYRKLGYEAVSQRMSQSLD